MQLHFLGANRQVTGSRYLLDAAGMQILIDCGMFQERAFQERNWNQSPINPSDVEVMLLTHAHLDHSGLIPRFVRNGFSGDILTTPASIDLARLILQDSGKIQEEDARYKQRRHEKEGRTGKHPVEPLFTAADCKEAARRLKPVKFETEIPLSDDITARYLPSGHILGAAIIEITVRENDAVRRIVFSGDIGPWDRPLMRDPTILTHADVVILESTYGDKNHESDHRRLDELADLINDTVQRGGNLVIPTFAIDRAQELMLYISQLVHDRKIPRLTVFLDSPMAVKATTIYKRYPHLLDDDAQALLKAGRHPFQFPGLHMTRKAEASRSINSVRGSCIIMAGSGMCTGGRIKHHLRHNLTRKESTILFVGYQAEGTLGRQIVEGDKEVRIHGRMYPVQARIERLEGLSAHAGREDLLRWLGGFTSKPRVFLTHGEAGVMDQLAETIRTQCNLDVACPEYGTCVEL